MLYGPVHSVARCESPFLGLLGTVSRVTRAPALVAAPVELSSGQGHAGLSYAIKSVSDHKRPAHSCSCAGTQSVFLLRALQQYSGETMAAELPYHTGHEATYREYEHLVGDAAMIEREIKVLCAHACLMAA